MSDAFVGEIRLFSYTIIPRGWLLCNGAVMQIQPNAALYSLLGTQFGGDGKTTFALPDLRSRTPIGGQYYYSQGKAGGSETVALTLSQVVPHTHTVIVSSQPGTSAGGTDEFLAQNATGAAGTPEFLVYAPLDTAKSTTLLPNTVQSTGGGAGHENRQPSLALSYCICTEGYYPPRT